MTLVCFVYITIWFIHEGVVFIHEGVVSCDQTTKKGKLLTTLHSSKKLIFEMLQQTKDFIMAKEAQ